MKGKGTVVSTKIEKQSISAQNINRISFVSIFQFYEIGLDKYAERNKHFTVPAKNWLQ